MGSSTATSARQRLEHPGLPNAAHRPGASAEYQLRCARGAMSSGPDDAGAVDAGWAAASPGTAALQALAAELKGSGKGGVALSSLTGAIDSLKTEQHRVREERKRLAKELKNAQRRKRRLKGKARQLSNDDLLAVLLMREETAAAAGASRATSSATESSTEASPGSAGAAPSSSAA